ncbi:MAG: tRNA uridine-5-carboxymethylaminomethyl(34) synthesis GTPase MnmE [Caldisericaceae bacterium]
MSNDTIVAISTPRGVGGIGVVRVSGPSALFIVSEIFSNKIVNPRYSYTGFVFDPQTNQRIDSAIATYFKAPHSYTGEDVCELSMHGGIVNLEMVVKIIIRLGARLADKGEFTKRALINGKMDLVEANAVMEVIEARTERALQIASARLFGELSNSVIQFRTDVIELIALIEAPIDFPFDAESLSKEVILENLIKFKRTAEGFLSTYKTGKSFREGFSVVIAGKPNVGKSTLLNTLLKFDRAIVSEVPGTTRDTIEELIDFRGLPVRLIDTAGYRSQPDLQRTAIDFIEALGIERAKKSIESSDLILFVFDAGDEITQEDLTLIELTRSKNRIIVLNKGDVNKVTTEDSLRKLFENEEIIEISALRRTGIDKLENAIYDKLMPNQYETPFITSEREKEIFEEIIQHIEEAIKVETVSKNDELVAEELRLVVETISRLLGENVGNEILDNIFTEFCIGK